MVIPLLFFHSLTHCCDGHPGDKAVCLEIYVLRDLLPRGAVLVGNLRVLGGIVLDEFIPCEVADVPSIRLLTVLKVEIMSQQF